jgi:drug/metabolite transporter (DMT)-like permease
VNTRAWIGLVFGLGLCGTGLAYICYYFVVANLGALAASSVTYIPSVVALVIGVFLVGDVINPLGVRCYDVHSVRRRRIAAWQPSD